MRSHRRDDFLDRHPHASSPRMGRLILSAPGTTQSPEIDALGPDSYGSGWIVTVYDNESNTIEQVIQILMIATHCDLREAEIETWEVHHLGRSVVHHGGEDDCVNVASIIATIGIQVQVSEEL